MKPFYKKITAFFRNLDLDEQEAVLMDLSQIHSERVEKEKMTKDYVGVMERMFGHKITQQTHDRGSTYARMAVSYEMARDGFSESQIGGVLHRHHCTVHYYKQTMQETIDMPYINKELHNLYQRYKLILG